MATGQLGGVVRHVHRLFGAGTVSGLAETQLLGRFVEHGDEAAFEALVSRHGPTVLSVCRRLLDDPGDVEDAFQATFLILVRKAASIRDPDRLGNWLYGVAHRVAARARAHGYRRRARERGGVDMSTVVAVAEPAVDELGRALHEEVGRLPEKYRAPVVLCDLEGQTHEEAARHLHWPVGTVKGRLFRARNLLRDRLARRGLATASTGAIALALSREASAAAVPAALVNTTVRAAIGFAAGKTVAAGLVPATAAALANEVTRVMFTSHLKLIAASLIATAVVATGAGVMAFQTGGGSEQEPKSGSSGATATKPSRAQNAPGQPASAGSPTVKYAEVDPADIQLGEKRQGDRRLKVATRYFDTLQTRYLAGVLSPESYIAGSARLMEAQCDANGDAGARIAAVAAHIKRLEAVVQTVRKSVESRNTPSSTLDEAELSLEEAKSLLARSTAAQDAASRAQPQVAGMEMATAGMMGMGGAGAIGSGDDAEDEAKNRLIRAALNKPLSMPFAAPTPLTDVISYVKQSTQTPELPDGIPIYLDPVAVEKNEIQEAPLTIVLDLEGVRLKTSLRLLLRQAELGYFVKEGLLMITSLNSRELQEEQARQAGVSPPMGGIMGGGMMGGMGGMMGATGRGN